MNVARSYAARIVQYAETWQGGNYKGLASYIGQQLTKKPPPTVPLATVTIQTIGPDGSRTEKNNNGNICDLWPSQRSQTGGSADSMHLVHLRGFLTPKCILDTGSQLSIDPEYFRRHLSFLQTRKRDHFDTFTSRSSARRFPCFKINTICIRQQPIRPSEVILARKQEREALTRYQRDITMDVIPGEPIARRYSVLNESVVAIEQHVSVCVKHRKDGDCYGT
jgi:hypothetical protein